MKLSTLYLAVATATTPIVAAAQTPVITAEPVTTSVPLDDFEKGKSNTLTCSSGGKSVQIVPLTNDANNSFIALQTSNEKITPTPLKDRQAGINACLNLNL